jgi:hypothetical protein
VIGSSEHVHSQVEELDPNPGLADLGADDVPERW